MPLAMRRRRILLALGLIVAGLAVLWFSVPLWWPWLLRPLALRSGAQFARYQREGYGALSLYGFTYTNESVRFQAQRVEVLTPTLWLSRLRKAPTQPFLRLSDWQLESVPAAKAPVGSSLYSEEQKLQADLRFLQRWLPRAVLSNGTVRVQKQQLGIPALTWSQGQLQARLEVSNLQALVRANLSNGPPYQLEVTSEPLHLESSIKISTNTAGLAVEGTSRWRNNPVELQAQFGHTGWVPEEASLQARNFQVPGSLLELPEYGDVRGTVAAQWQQGHFNLDLSAGARPVPAEEDLPPLELQLHARGNTNRAVIDTAVVTSPWLRAELSRELEVHFTGPLLREPANLILTADLSRQPWLTLQGKLYGVAAFTPTARRYPAVHFELAGMDVGAAQLKAKVFRVEGVLDWPALAVTNAAARFADGSTASVGGWAELRKRRVESGWFDFSGPLARHWLPAGYSYQTLSVAGQFHGPFKELNHSGRLVVTNLVSPELRPLNVRVEWQGRQMSLSHVQADMAADGSALTLAGALTVEQGGGQLRLEALTLRQRGKPVLSLDKPAQLSLHHRAAPQAWQVQVDGFRWAGTGGQLQAQAALDWPRSGQLQASARGLRPELVQDFLQPILPAVELRALKASAGWTNGPVEFAAELSAVEIQGNESNRLATAQPAGKIAPGAGTALSPLPVEASPGAGTARSPLSALSALSLAGELKATGDAHGVSLQQFELTSQGTRVASFHGFVPVRLNPSAPDDLVQVQPQGPLELNGLVQSYGVLWDKLSAWTGVRLQGPHLTLQLAGTPSAPQGRVQLQVQQIQFPKSKQPLPSVTDLSLDLGFEREQARLTEGRLLLQGQPVSLSAELPLGEAFWAQLKQRKLPNWEKASAHLQMQNATLAAFAELYPELVSPQGEAHLDLSLLPGFKLDGYLAVQRARTRPLPSVGPVRDINLKLLFRERRIEMSNGSANLGGSTVLLSGQADLGDIQWLKSMLAGRSALQEGISNAPPHVGAYKAVPGTNSNWQGPPFSFTLFGTNVPLVRRPEAIVRGDLLLNAAKTNDAAPLISGTVRLHDSFFLSDLAALIPGKIEVPSQRPPYFSITNEPLADWRLALQVTGERFLRARTTVFNGEVSSHIKLEGSLKNPIALGDIKIDSGLVQFPFGNLEVQQGFVTLTSQNPYHPQLSLSATSRQFGYDIKMQVTGTIDAPVIQFSSNPPLSSEQILLLLTAGELPPGTFSLTTQQRAQTLAMFLGQDLLRKLGFGGTGQQRLTIRSGEEIAETGRPTYTVEFKLSDTVSLVGEYDRFGDYNAGVKWRIYSK